MFLGNLLILRGLSFSISSTEHSYKNMRENSIIIQFFAIFPRNIALCQHVWKIEERPETTC